MPPEQVPQAVDEPLVTNVTLVLEPEDRERFLGALHEVPPRARTEAACVHLDVGEEVLQPPCSQRCLAATEPLYAAPRTVLVLSPVDPQERRG